MLNLPRWQTIVIIAITVLSGLFALPNLLPNRVLAVAGADDLRAAEVVPLLRDRPARNGKATAYVCERFACRAPVTEPSDLAAELA